MKLQKPLIFLVLAIAFFVRILPLNQSYWLDESINVRAVKNFSLTELVTSYSLGDFHPPLFHLILKSWTIFFGYTEVATRMLSVIFGLVTVYFTYLIGVQIWGNKKIRIGQGAIELHILPAFLLATSGLHIYYSGEARMYSLAAMFTTMAVYYSLRVISNKKIKLDGSFLGHFFTDQIKKLVKFKYWSRSLKQPSSSWLIFSLLGMLLSDYVPWLLYPVFIILVPVHALIALVLTSPWWPFFYKQLQIGLGTASEFPLWGQVVGGFSLKNVALIPVKFLIGRVSIENNYLYAVSMGILGILLGIICYRAIKVLLRKSKLVHFVPLLWLLVPISIGTILSTQISLLSYFRFLFVLPAFYLLLVQGIDDLTNKLGVFLLAVFIGVNLISTTAYISQPQFHRENWRAFSEWIDSRSVNSAISVIPNLAQADPYQFYQKQVPIIDDLDQVEQLPESFYLIRYLQEIFDPNDSLRKQIEQLDYKLVEQKAFTGVIVWHYQRTDRVFARFIE